MKDLCYLAIPGFLPPPIHELLYSSLPDSNRTLEQTTREFHHLLQALPIPWKTLIYNAPTTAASTPQPTFEISPANPTDPPTPLQNCRTRQFYQDLVTYGNTNPLTIPHWQATLQPPPTFNKQFWKNHQAVHRQDYHTHRKSYRHG